MSRDEIVFSKRAVIVVAVLSTLGGVASIGWFAHVAFTNIEKQTTIALAQVTASVSSLKSDVREHVKVDDDREERDREMLANLEARVHDVERDVGRMTGALGDMLPPSERRRKVTR